MAGEDVVGCGRPDAACTIQAALAWGVGALTRAGVDSPRLDGELLLAHALRTGRAQLIARAHDCLGPDQREAFCAIVQRRAQREPLAYIVGHRAFYDLDLAVSSDVLVPRPETEGLVEAALCWARGQPGRLRLADVGTGSGAIAASLLRHLPDALVVATDISWPALAMARRNLEQALSSRGTKHSRYALVQSDLLSAFAGPSHNCEGGAFDLIAANLPYVRRDELDALMPEVSRYEPRLALDGGESGLDAIERLLPQAAACLAAPGLLLLEIDPRQAADIVTLAQRFFPEAETSVLQDLAGLDRVVRIEQRGQGHAS